jgi:hypothetical protein
VEEERKHTGAQELGFQVTMVTVRISWFVIAVCCVAHACTVLHVALACWFVACACFLFVGSLVVCWQSGVRSVSLGAIARSIAPGAAYRVPCFRDAMYLIG